MLRLPRRSGVNRARDQILAGPALAGDEDGQVVALQPLDLIGDALHGGTGAHETRQQRLELPLDLPPATLDRPLARAAQIESLAEHGGERAQPAQRAAGPSGRAARDDREAGDRPRRGRAASTSVGGGRSGRTRAAVAASARARVGVTPGGSDHARPAPAAAHR